MRQMSRQFAVDCALVIAFAVSTILTSAVAGDRAAQKTPTWLGYLLLILLAAFLVVRRRYPTQVMVLTMLVSVLYNRLGYGTGAFTIAPAIAIYTTILAKH